MQVDAMNPAYTEFAFPQIKPYPWNKIFRQRAPPGESSRMPNRFAAMRLCRSFTPLVFSRRVL